MHILFTRFPLESAYGGAEVQTLMLAEGLRKKGHDIGFLGSCPVLLERFQVSSLRQGFPLRSSSFEGQVGRQAGFRCQTLEIGEPPVTKWGAVSFLWRKRGMRRELIEGVKRCLDTPSRVIPSDPVLVAKTQDCIEGSTRLGTRHDTVIFMLSLSEKLLLTDWAVSKGIKVFWIEHDRIGRWLTMNPWLPRLRKLSKLATTIVVSDLSRDLYIQLGWDPKKIVSIPNGVDVEKFQDACHGERRRTITSVSPFVSAQGDTPTFHIGCIARLTHDKGVALLIEAVSGLSNVHLTIVGDGREKQHLEKLIERKTPAGPLGIARGKLRLGEGWNNEKRVTLLPTVDPAAFYKTIDCCVLPSREHDPFGLIAAEAMASGIPIIVTDACGIARHLTQNEDALIVPAGNVPALRNAIQTLQEFPQVAKKLSERGPVVARERFSKERMVNEYEKLLS